jgi:hypothetical protein
VVDVVGAAVNGGELAGEVVDVGNVVVAMAPAMAPASTAFVVEGTETTTHTTIAPTIDVMNANRP